MNLAQVITVANIVIIIFNIIGMIIAPTKGPPPIRYYVITWIGLVIILSSVEFYRKMRRDARGGIRHPVSHSPKVGSSSGLVTYGFAGGSGTASGAVISSRAVALVFSPDMMASDSVMSC